MVVLDSAGASEEDIQEVVTVDSQEAVMVDIQVMEVATDTVDMGTVDMAVATQVDLEADIQVMEVAMEEVTDTIIIVISKGLHFIVIKSSRVQIKCLY